MKITQLSLASQGNWPELSIEQLAPDLSICFGRPRSGKSTLARLAAHLLYGRPDGSGRSHAVQSAPLTEGSIQVESPQGKFVLRRHRDQSPQGRLSIAATDGVSTDNQTIRSLLYDLSPTLLADLYFVDFAQGPQAQQLLGGEFAREFSQALAGDSQSQAIPRPSDHPTLGAPAPLDRRQIDELVRRRDETIQRIEQLVARLRHDGQSFEAELRELEKVLAARRRAFDDLQTRLRAADGKLAQIEARSRYFALESSVRRSLPGKAEALAEQLIQLDDEISRCRQMLSDLQSREATIRRQTAEVRADGTADGATSLADQRATLGVFERLLDDLDAEVSQLARSHEPGRCIGCDAHGRFLPVAQLLRQQVYALCGQVTEQERAARRGALRIESRQLARAQTDLSEQLEHLLERRQLLIHESELVNRPVVLSPQPPVDAHCGCQDHARFVQDAEVMALARGNRLQQTELARSQRSEAEQERNALRSQCDSAQLEIEELESRWQRLQRQRAHSRETATLDELRRSLEQIELAISRSLGGELSSGADDLPEHRRAWKASDALAQLTDGELVQIRTSRDGNGPAVIDRSGHVRQLDQLVQSQQDQVYVALTLALVSSLAGRGVDLPLFMDEPFLRQNPRDAAAMAGVLFEFARQGRQVIVLTENRDAVRRFESLDALVLDIDSLRRSPARLPRLIDEASIASHSPERPASSTALRIVRETVSDLTPPLRVATEAVQADDKSEVYFLHLDASLADFPVLGNETEEVFGHLGIHTVRDLILTDAAKVAAQLQRPTITRDTVRLWQSHMNLMCFVPGVSLNDAQVLAANDVTSPEALLAVDARVFGQTVERFLQTAPGRRFVAARTRLTAERLLELQHRARGQRRRWEELSRLVQADEHRSRQPELASPTIRKALRTKPSPRHAALAVGKTPAPPLRFMLNRTSPVEDAPSIGPVAAKNLARVGIRSVADLLNANPESTAEELGESQVTAAVVARWQSEARLACCIPELRDRSARLLVAAGFTEPAQLAGVQVSELVKRVGEVCRSKQGRRILHDGPAPTTAKIERWASLAKHMRPLEAA